MPNCFHQLLSQHHRGKLRSSQRHAGDLLPGILRRVVLENRRVGIFVVVAVAASAQNIDEAAAHGGSVPAAGMAVATAFTPRISHPSQAIARRLLRLSERPLTRSSRSAMMRTLVCGARPCEVGVRIAGAVHAYIAVVRCRIRTDVYRS